MAIKITHVPTEWKRISQLYSARHKGIDLAAPKGTPVFAAAKGVVVASGYSPWDPKGSYGYEVAIKHEGGFTNYAHLSRIYVRVGESVRSGEIIGLVGSTGRSSGPHLHFEVHKGRKWNRINPKPYLSTSKTYPRKAGYVIGKKYALREKMNVRSGPGTKYAIVGKLPKKYRVFVLDIATNDGGVWLKFDSGKWVCAIGRRRYI